MHCFPCLATAVLLCSLGSQGLAGDAVRCMQRQLNALGYTVGDADGRIGPATRAGLDRYEAVVGPVTRRDLSQATAIIHCRKLGMRHALARTFWGSRTERFNILSPAGTPSGEIYAVEKGLLASLDLMRDRYGIDLAGTFVVVIGSDQKKMMRLAKGHFPPGFTVPDIAGAIAQSCSRGSEAGTSTPGLLFICTSESTGILEFDRLERIRTVAAHEATHEAQWQLAGSDSLQIESSQVALWGPSWLVEGVADFIEFGGMSRFDQTFELRTIKRHADQTWSDLRKLEQGESARKAGNDLYRVGKAAVWYISLESKRRDAPLAFFDLIGEGLAWPEAFERAFGQTPEAFYKRWDKLLADFPA